MNSLGKFMILKRNKGLYPWEMLAPCLANRTVEPLYGVVLFPDLIIQYFLLFFVQLLPVIFNHPQEILQLQEEISVISHVLHLLHLSKLREVLEQSFVFDLRWQIHKQRVITRRCVFAEQLADDVLALNPPEDQEGKYDK